VREFFWPSAGWRRAFLYLRYRVARLPGSPYSIAAGLACGAAISFTPFIGLHLLLAVLLAWMLGVNVLASAIGTAVGNPWTFPLIWMWTYRLGAWVLGMRTVDPAHSTVHLSLGDILIDPIGTLGPLLLPMTVGGLITGIAVWWAVFWSVGHLLTSYRERRRRHLEERLEKRLEASAASRPQGNQDHAAS